MHLAFRSKPFYFSKIKKHRVRLWYTYVVKVRRERSIYILHSTRPVIGSRQSIMRIGIWFGSNNVDYFPFMQHINNVRKNKILSISYNVSNLIILFLPNATQNTCEQHRVIFQQLLLDLKNNDLNVVIVIESIRNNLKKPVIFHTFWLLGHLKNTCPLSSSSIFTKHKRACNPLLYPSIRHGSKSNYFTFDGALTFHTKFQLHTNT
jgi:hypothetical protein